MKKTIFAFALGAIILASCNKSIAPVSQTVYTAPDETGQVPLYFGTKGLDVNVQTKGDVTSLSSFYLTATTGSTSQSSVSGLSNASFTGSSEYTCTGKYWPVSDPNWNFYASNESLTFSSSGCTVSPSTNTTDIVVAYLPSNDVTYKAKNTLTFNHIYCKIGTVSIGAPSGFSISNISFSLSAYGAGTYNLLSDSWTSKSSSVTISTEDSGTYIVPDTYTLSVTATVTKGTYTNTLTKTGSVSLEKGKTNNISATFPSPGEPDLIKFSVSITPWGFVSKQVTWN